MFITSVYRLSETCVPPADPPTAPQSPYEKEDPDPHTAPQTPSEQEDPVWEGPGSDEELQMKP